MEEIVIGAVVQKVNALIDLGKTGDAMAAYESIIDQYNSNVPVGVARSLGRSLLATA